MNINEIKRQLVFFSVLGISFACAFPVFAQVAQQGVDFTPVANNLITTFAGVITVAATVISGFLIKFLSSRAGVNNTQLELLVQQQVDHFIVMSVQYGEAWLKAQVADPASPIKHLTFNSLVLDVMLGYFKSSAAGIIAKQRERFSDDRIRQMITARVSPLLKPPVVNGGELQTVTNDAVVISQPLAVAPNSV